MDGVSKKTTKTFGAEVGKVLQLVIHSIYTNKDIFLRELISNASDACDKLRYASLLDQTLSDTELLKIVISVDKANDYLIIKDNGIGMNEQDMVDNLGTIASSGTQKFLEQLSDNNKKDMQLIGNFGVGFYSAFMVSDLVTVYSTKAGEDKTYVWESNGQGEYSIAEAEEKLSRGTIIKLKIKKSETEFLEKYRIKNIVTTYSDHILFPIELLDEEGKTEVINTSSAIWMKPQSEITAEQYKEFFQHLSHYPDEPFAIMHNKTEGLVTYTSLLYIPKQKPLDLFQHDRKSKVKLYIKRVFITEDSIELVPLYMRFLNGIIDSEDLPLNISRETLQSNATLHKIRKSIVKKVLNTLKNKAETEKEEYNNFWQNFGEVLKEGLCDPTLEEKEELLDICRFYTTKSDNNLISFDDYICNMINNQEDIYYVTGSNIDVLRNNPHLEGFKKRDIEVILLVDQVDNFWVNVNNKYKNKSIKAITSSGIDLDKIKKFSSDGDENKSTENNSNDEALIAYIKTVLNNLVQDVKISTKLISSPACLVVPEGSMNIRLEKFLIEQKQLSRRAAKILEINPEHPLLVRIKKDIETENTSKKTSDLVEILFYQACLIEGEAIDNPLNFVQKINTFL